jgi:hypothetical protein
MARLKPTKKINKEIIFDQKDWDLIEEVTKSIFYYVAGADGIIQKNELIEFKEIWCNKIKLFKSSPFLSAQTEALFKEIGDRFSISKNSTMNISVKKIIKDIEKFSLVLRKKQDQNLLEETEVLSIKIAFINLAKDIAKSAGGIMRMKKVSPEENEAIANIQAALNL